MLVLARACGLLTAESKVISIGARDVLLIKRFDREKTEAGYRRARMVSALTLLRTDDSVQLRDKWSYVVLVEKLGRVSAEPKKDAAELFRRMCFNALISNTDDHPRNHAIIAKGQDWQLSPGYDLTPLRMLAPNAGAWPWSAAIKAGSRTQETCFPSPPASCCPRTRPDPSSTP